MSALLAKAAGMALAKHPIMNAGYVTDGIQVRLHWGARSFPAISAICTRVCSS